MTEMEASCRAANHSVCGTSRLKHIFDIKSWLSPYLEEIHGHTVSHRRDSEGRAVMLTKHWSHEDWEPNGGLKILKVCIYDCSCFLHILYLIEELSEPT